MLTRLLGKTCSDSPEKQVDVDDKMVTQFLSELMPEFKEKRQQRRVSFSQEATIYLDEEQTPIPVMIRDVSVNGMGFTHDIPIKPAEVSLRIHNENGKALCARLSIRWCREMMRHYYFSGGEFVRVFEDDPIKLNNIADLDELLSQLSD